MLARYRWKVKKVIEIGKIQVNYGIEGDGW